MDYGNYFYPIFNGPGRHFVHPSKQVELGLEGSTCEEWHAISRDNFYELFKHILSYNLDIVIGLCKVELANRQTESGNSNENQNWFSQLHIFDINLMLQLTEEVKRGLPAINELTDNEYEIVLSKKFRIRDNDPLYKLVAWDRKIFLRGTKSNQPGDFTDIELISVESLY